MEKYTRTSKASKVNSGTLFTGRVTAIILNPNTYPQLFKDKGQYAAIGGIEFIPVSSPNPNTEEGSKLFAYPLFPNIKHYPVEDETVVVLRSTDTGTSETAVTSTYYYLPPTNTWNTTHYNASPDKIYKNRENPKISVKSYQEVERGSFQKEIQNVNTQTSTITGFTEQADITNLQPFSGDLTIEGRWSNGIRLSATPVESNRIDGTWTADGKTTSPIITVANGRPKSNTSYLPQVEDLRYDQSSIYLTSTQKIKFLTYPEYKTTSFNNINPPTAISEYTKPQTIVTSDRVTVFGRDSIINNAPLLHFNTNRLNIDSTGEVTVQASRVNLGSGNPDELQPALKGDQTQVLLDEILDTLKQLVQACATATGTVPIASLQKFAAENITRIQKLNTSTIKSDDTFIV